MESLRFPRGNIYQIVCHEGNAALKVNTSNPHDNDGARIVGVPPDINDIGQLWMVEKVGQDIDQFEIGHCQSALVWDEEGREIILRRPK